VYVQSIDFADTELEEEAQKQLYMKTLLAFHKHLATDKTSLCGQVVHHLTDTYNCSNVKTFIEMTALRFEVFYPPDKMLSLQCDQSSGHLAEELQRHLVTKDMLKRLDIQDMTLASELSTH